MRFDMTQDDTQAPAETADRPLVPPGTHVLTIVHAEEGPNSYKQSDENPDGLCLKLRLGTDGGHKFIFDDIPQHLAWRAKQFAAALAIVPAGDALDLEPSELVGQKVTVEITHYTSKAGKVSAVVKRYVPATAAPKAASKPAAKRSNLAAVRAAFPDDDIPF
ncbi:MAG: hypothetical protein EBR82_79800 [Caulobacteraceae bacterium]|nr:hypothetical protein [Caulobacteraceae bacterium]